MFTKRIFALFIALLVIVLSSSSTFASDENKKVGEEEVATDVKTNGNIKNEEVAADAKKNNKIKLEEKTPDAEVESVKTININKATAIELSSVLKKVGPKYAKAIVKYREDNGAFKTPEDIKNVKGIGDKIFELNKDVIVVKD